MRYLYIFLSLLLFSSCAPLTERYYTKQTNKKRIAIINNSKKLNDTIQPIADSIKNNIKNYINSSIRINNEKKKYYCTKIDKLPIIQSGLGEFFNNMTAMGMFIPLKDSKTLGGKTKYDVGIFINQDIINRNKETVSNTIEHELYHYVDYLLGGEYDFISSKNKIHKYIDSAVLSDNNASLSKLLSLLKFEEYTKDTDAELKITPLEFFYLNNLNSEFRMMYKYYSSPAEIYVRFQLMKSDMVKYNIINSINDKIDKYHLVQLLSTMSFIQYYFNNAYYNDYLFLIMVIDVDELNKLDEEIGL